MSTKTFMLEDCARSGLSEKQVDDLGFAPCEDGYTIPYIDPVTGLPMTCPDGRPFVRTRLQDPTAKAKYLSPKNGGIRAYIPRRSHELLTTDKSLPLYLTEGEKKAAAASLEGLPIIGLGGIWNWLQKGKTDVLNADLIPYIRDGREVILVYDSDATKTPKKARQFADCARRLSEALRPYNATLYRVDLPQLNGSKVGLDDFLVSGKTIGDLQKHIASTRQKISRPDTAPAKIRIDGEWIKIVQHIAAAVAPHHAIFVHGGEVVRLATEDGSSSFEPLSAAAACSEFERFCAFERSGKGGAIPTRMAEASARLILAAPELSRRLRRIERLCDYPQPVRDPAGGIRLTRPGYDEEVRTFTDPAGPVPEKMELAEGLKALTDLLSGFCFADHDGDGGTLYTMNALVYLLTCHCKALIEPERCPLFYAGGNRPGVGKDFLLGLGPLLTTGRPPEFHPPTDSAEETRKRILSLCRSGKRFMLISNARGHLADVALEQACTSPVHTDRVLGKSEELTFQNCAIYGLSGNGLSYSEDLARRMVPIELAYFEESIETRTYTHPDLYAHVLTRRGYYLGALQAIVQNWIDGGCPDGSKGKASFVQWSRVVGGMLEAAGLPNPINEGSTATAPNEEVEHFGNMLAEARARFGGRHISNVDVRNVAADLDLFGWLGDLQGDRSARTRFGLIIRRMERRRIGGHYMTVDRSSKRPSYKVEVVS